MTKKKIIKTIFFYILIVAVCIIAVFPFYWLVNTSSLETNALFKIPPHFYPSKNILNVYVEYLRNNPFLKWFLNSLIVSTIATALSTILAIFGSYSLSRFRFKGRVGFLFFNLLTQMMPPVFLVIPLYILYVRLQLNDTLIGLTILYIAITLPIGTLFIKGFFDSIPRELDDAAEIDGCNKMQRLIMVILPISFPGIMATAVWSFIICWDEFVIAYTILSSSKKWVISVGLSSHIGQYSTSWNVVMSGAVLATIPIVVFFLFFQRYLISGLTAGSVKE